MASVAKTVRNVGAFRELAAGLRPVTLSILRLDGELSMALTDSRGLARIRKVPISMAILPNSCAAFEAAGSPSPDAVRHSGAVLFERASEASARSLPSRRATPSTAGGGALQFPGSRPSTA
jgi:hypothetical protein